MLPFLSGGDLVQWIGAHVSRLGQFGARPALEIGQEVGTVLRGMLQLPRPLVHGDVKPQNVLLPTPDAAAETLTMIDLDAASELEQLPADGQQVARGVIQSLVSDVNGFGELLFMLATGREPPSEGEPTPATGNTAFDELVVKCMTADVDTHAYSCLGDEALWRDFEYAVTVEHARKQRPPLSDLLHSRPLLAIVGIVLLCLLLLAVASKMTRAADMALDESEAPPPVERLLEPRTPLGRPVGWAEVAMVSDIGDSHELNDDRCLIMTSRDLGHDANGPLGDYMLCLLADGATGSTFGGLVTSARTPPVGEPASSPRRPSWSAS